MCQSKSKERVRQGLRLRAEKTKISAAYSVFAVGVRRARINVNSYSSGHCDKLRGRRLHRVRVNLRRFRCDSPIEATPLDYRSVDASGLVDEPPSGL